MCRSLSYILLLGGFGYLLLAFFYLIMDVFPIWNGAPFIYPGTYVYILLYKISQASIVKQIFIPNLET